MSYDHEDDDEPSFEEGDVRTQREFNDKMMQMQAAQQLRDMLAKSQHEQANGHTNGLPSRVNRIEEIPVLENTGNDDKPKKKMLLLPSILKAVPNLLHYKLSRQLREQIARAQ
jgi:hypothetical protein